MYQINDKFRAAMKSPVIVPKLRGSVAGVPFTAEDIALNSFRVCNQCVDVSQIALGGVFIGELKLTLLPTVARTRGGWVGKEIYIEYGLDCNGEDIYIPCPSGYYYIYSANWTADGLEVIAYDSMSKLDKGYSEERSNGSAYDWLNYISNKTGVRIGNSRAEIEAMPNGTQTLGLFTADEITTYRDLLMFLAATLCGFATCGRDGSIVIKSFNSTVVDSIDETKRFAGASFSDYVTRYTGLSIVDIETRELVYYSMPTDDGLTMKLGSNPFLQYGTPAIKKQMREAILNGLQYFSYVPYTVTLLGCCAYDLGDVIEFTGGISGGGVVGCLMSYDFSFNDYSFAGYGDNPALINAQSKLDKEINGIYNQNTAEYATVTPLTNVSEININEDWTSLGRLSFSVSKKQNILFHSAIKISDLSDNGITRFKYVLNGEENDFIHESYVTEDTDTVTLFLPVPIEPDVFYMFEVFAETDGATGTIQIGDLKGALFGLGVVGDTWDGTLEFRDRFELGYGRRYQIPFNDNEPTFVTQTPMPVVGSDNFTLNYGRRYQIAFNERFSVVTQTGIFDLITQSGDPLTTEAGDPYITNGGRT